VNEQTMHNSDSGVYRVRRVGSELHFTYDDGRPPATFPILNRRRYRSRLSLWQRRGVFGSDGVDR
jgi:hypothetical protein